jgi:two-component system, cell cycle sensor histidine kinase and response regulator CckA
VPTNDDKTVLAVDDDPDVLRLVEAILRRFGFRVLAAASADEALEIFSGLEHPPDLLLTDVVMPGVSGPVLADRLLAAEPQMRVLFMSGYDNRQIVQHYVVKPGFPLIPKPFTHESLAAKVREILAAPQIALNDRPSV